MARNAIFVPLGGGPGDRAALAAAITLAKAMDAEIEAVFLDVDDASVVFAAGDGGSALGVDALEALREERGRARAAALAAGAQAGVTVETPGGGRSAATARARLAALTVVDPDAARGEGALADVMATLLLEDGAAVLAPRKPPPYPSVAVAWDGSREAARAVKAAAPVIALAERLVVVQSPDAVKARNQPAADPERLRRWLARCNPRAAISAVSFDGEPSRALLPAIAGAGVDLAVAGAFGHARLREVIFGGVTRSLLMADAPSILLSH